LIDFVRLLIEKGADASATTNEGWNPLHFLFRNISEIFNKGIDVIGLASMLIQNGANVNARTSKEWTPLHFVCQYCDSQNMPIDLTYYLVEVHNADLDAIRAGDDVTPSKLLVQKGCYEFY